MTTLKQNIMRIPEQVITGTGSYVIPANKFGFISMSTCSAGVGYAYGPGVWNSGDGWGLSGSGSGNANANHQWLTEGDSITTQVLAETFAGNSIQTNRQGYARVLINGVNACVSASRSGAGGASQSGIGNVIMIHSSDVGWSVSLYSIPKNNFPDELKEGN